MGGEDGCDGSLEILFCVPDTHDVKQKNNSLETIPSRFPSTENKEVFYFTSSEYTKCEWNFGIH